MKIHEYQAKKLLAEYGIPVPRGAVAKSPAEAGRIAAQLKGKVVLKSQVHAGGRGKAGGIKTADTPQEAERIAGELLGKQLVTHQTGPKGVPVNALLVEEAVEAAQELYLGITLDMSAGMPVVMASESGGMEIEEVAARSPEKILRSRVDVAIGLFPFQARQLAYGLNLKGDSFRTAVKFIPELYRLYREKDCSLVEINPLVITSDGRLIALDGKVNIDDNALFRHADMAAMRDPSQEDPIEVQAKSKGIENFIKLDGNIGNIVNGAGLAMAVMDGLKFAGGSPANFLDIGTVNDPERAANALKLVCSDPNVKAVMVNIFGGMARVDVMATGLVKAAKELGTKLPPTVVRLAGTNVAEGEKVLAESGLKFIRARTFKEAADKAVAAAKGKKA